MSTHVSSLIHHFADKD
jgi:hypothetical protein